MAFPGSFFPGTTFPSLYFEKYGYASDPSVRTFNSRVLVNGQTRPVESWSVGRELSGDLPQQVVAASGIAQATGSVVWAAEDDVSSGARNPWNKFTGWIPARGDRVEIFIDDGNTEWKQFHGVIDKTTGSINGGFQSVLIDDYDRLSAEVSHEPLLSIMPPQQPDGSEDWRRIGLHPLYFVDYALRRAGYHATPPREPYSTLHAPLQGSLWPNWGFLRSATLAGFNEPSPWGLSRRAFQAQYAPALTRNMSDTTQLSMMIAPDHASPVDFFLDYGSAEHHLRLAVDSSKIVRAIKNNVEICRLSMGDATVISMLCKSGQVSLRTNTGANATGSFAPSGPNLTGIRVNASDSAMVSGLQVSHPETAAAEHMSTRWVPSAHYDTRSLRLAGIINASPNIEGVKASELLDEINQSLLAAMWIDEEGVMQWAQSDTLRMREPSHTISTLDDVLSLDWEIGLLQSSSQVTVKGRQPSITRGRWRNTVLARGNAGSMKSGDELEVFLEPETDTDWIMPSYDFIEIGGTVGIWGSYNQPSYSAVGMYFSSDGGTTEVAGLNCTITTAQLGRQKALVKYAAGSWPSDVEGVIATSPVAAGLWPKNRDNDLPRLVGMGKVLWLDDSITIQGAGGPGPELVHDAGVWANRTVSDSTMRNLAEFISTQTAVPQPVISGLGIVPNPALRLGSVVSVRSENFMGVTMTALVTEVTTSFGASLEQSIAVRIIGATSTSQTFEAFDESLPSGSLTYEQLNILATSPQTYQQFNVDI